jgi:hypothetical protein
MFKFTIEVGGQAVAVVAASDRLMLDAFVDGDLDEGKTFRSDLMCFDSNGSPLWDGKSPITYRLATPKEEGDFDATFGLAVSEGEVADMDEENFIYWLVKIDPDELDEEQALIERQEQTLIGHQEQQLINHLERQQQLLRR